MKKQFCLILLALAIGLNYAKADGEGSNVPLECKPIKTGDELPPLPKSPIQIPMVYLDGNVLSFDAALEGCTVQLLDEDEIVVFSDFIEENQTSLVLPSTLSGTYELQIVCGNIIFYAIIEL